MMGKTHMGTGALAWALVAPHTIALTTSTTAAGLAVATAAALGPDCDHHGSTASRALFGPLRGVVAPAIAGALGGHRAGTHSIWSVAVVGLAGWLLPTPWWGPQAWLGLALALGWAAHILGDMLTVQGVKVLWPLSSRDIRLARLQTGGRAEQAFSLAQGVVLAMALGVLAGVLSWTDIAAVWRLVT